MKKHQGRLLGILIFASVLWAVLWSLHRHSSSDLCSGATRVAVVREWPLGFEGVFLRNTPFVWLDDHTLFHFVGDGMHGYRAVRLDTRTHAETPLPALTATQSGLIVKPSPDGRRVLWVEHPRVQSVPVATAVDGSAVVRWPRHWYNDNLAWTPDGEGWVWVTSVPTPGGSLPGPKGFAYGFEAFRVDRPGVRQIPLATPGAMPSILGCTGPDRVLAVAFGGTSFSRQEFQNSGGLPLVEYALGATATPVRTFSVPVPGPPDAQDVEVRLSPQGDRLLWYFQIYHLSPLMPPARRLHIPYSDISRSVDVWVSRVDGGGPHQVGMLKLGRRDYLARPVEWTPDGRRISFVYDGVLWTKPVEGNARS